MKKIFISINVIFIIFLICSGSFVYAADDSSWVSEAFSATSKFLKEKPKDTIGISPAFELFKNIIQGLNRVLRVAWAGISTIALAVTGVRYILAGASPTEEKAAKKSLKTIIIGMAIGFGAYAIWRIAMAIVTIIISSFSQS